MSDEDLELFSTLASLGTGGSAGLLAAAMVLDAPADLGFLLLVALVGFTVLWAWLRWGGEDGASPAGCRPDLTIPAPAAARRRRAARA